MIGRCTWQLVTEPAQEPITLADAKAQARITQDASNELIARYITAAREQAERHMNRALFTQTWRMDLDRFYEEMPLPMAAPLQSVTTVKYYDTNSTLQTLSATVYTVDTMSRPGQVVRASAQAWPALQADRLAGLVQITYVAGWATIDAIPERIKQGIRLYVTHLDRNRDGSAVGADVARQAAESCWSDVVTWMEPSHCEVWR